MGIERLEDRTLLSGLSLVSTTHFGGAGDQTGTDVEVLGGSVFVSGFNQPQHANVSSFLVKYATPTTDSSTPVFAKTWTFGLLKGIAAHGNSVYGAGFSHPSLGLTHDGSGGTEVKTLLTSFDANNVSGSGPGGSNWAAVIPQGTFNSSPGTSFFSFNGSETYNDAVAVDIAGSTFIYTIGSAQPCSHTSFVVGKYDSAGNILAGATAASANFNVCSAPVTAQGNVFGLVELNGDIYTAGGIRDSGGPGRPTVWKYDNNLNVQWKDQDSSIIGDFSGMATDGTSIYAVGQTSGDPDYIIAKYDQAGNQLWSTVSGGVGTTEVLRDVVAVDGRLFAVGYTNGSGAGGDDMVIMEIDPSTGAIVTTETFGGAQTDRAVRVTTDGTDLYVVGESRSFAVGGNVVGQNDLVLLRYSFDTNDPPVVAATSSLQGMVWEDFNNDGEVNFGEKAIESVTIQLLDENGTAIDSTTTDDQGMYWFVELEQGTYGVMELQPLGYVDGMDIVGEIDGLPVGDNSVNDKITGIVLSDDTMALNYNFGERPETRGTVTPGQTATIGYWQNKNGQELLGSVNGGLGDWLATTFTNLYGNDGDGDVNPFDLTGKTNQEVAEFFKVEFKRKSKDQPAGPTKLNSQVMAAAFAVYVTNSNLAGLTGLDYGFSVTDTGVGTLTINVGDNGEAFGVADGSDIAILDALFAVDSFTQEGLLYDDFNMDSFGDGAVDSFELALRVAVNEVFTMINEDGDI